MSTFQQTFDETKGLAGMAYNTFSDGTSDTGLLKALINNSNKKNATLAPAQYTDTSLATVASTAQYNLPSDFSSMVDMYFMQGTRKIEIKPLSEDNFLKLESIISNSLQFLYYTLRKTTIAGVPTKQVWIYPIPSGVTTIYYRYITTQTSLIIDPSVSTDSTKNLIAENGFEILDQYYALYHIFTVREQPTQAKQWKDLYDQKWKEYKAYTSNYYDTLVVKQGLNTSINPNLYPVLQ